MSLKPGNLVCYSGTYRNYLLSKLVDGKLTHDAISVIPEDICMFVKNYMLADEDDNESWPVDEWALFLIGDQLGVGRVSEFQRIKR